MNKIISLLLAITVSLGIAACSGKTARDNFAQSDTETISTGLSNSPTSISADNSDLDGYSEESAEEPQDRNTVNQNIKVKKDGSYTDKDHVALYIHTYGKLPKNYIRKRDAQDLGWISSKGNLHDVAPGMSIGGDKFGNYENRLPKASGRQYYECDIDYSGGRRNAKRIIFSNDGLVFYTSDHYSSFKQIY